MTPATRTHFIRQYNLTVTATDEDINLAITRHVRALVNRPRTLVQILATRGNAAWAFETSSTDITERLAYEFDVDEEDIRIEQGDIEADDHTRFDQIFINNEHKGWIE